MKGGTMPSGWKEDGHEFVTSSMETHGTMPSYFEEMRRREILRTTGTYERETVNKEYKHIIIPITKRQVGHGFYLIVLIGSIIGVTSGRFEGQLPGILGLIFGNLLYIIIRLSLGDDLNPFHLLKREIKFKK